MEHAMQRRRFKQIISFAERLAEEARRAKAAAAALPHGAARDLLLEKARQAETAAHINEWLSSPGLQPPR
jgi:hypothetical protein